MSKLLPISICIAGLLFSCGLVDLTRITCTTFPTTRGVILGTADPVWIEFSEPVEKESAEMIFKVLSPSGSRKGDLTWQGTRLIFTPQPAWDPGIRYVLSFSGEVQADNGRRFAVSLAVPFFSVTDDLPAQLFSSDPPSGGIIGSGETVTFTFTKEMDTEISIDDYFSLTPGTAYTHEWLSAGTELIIRPQTLWEPLELYSWTINSKLKDTSGIALYKEYSGTFLVQNPEAPAPEVASLEPAVNSWEFGFPVAGDPLTRTENTRENWIGWQDAIRINFAYPDPANPPGPDDPARIDFSSLQRAFSIDPQVNGSLICIKKTDGSDDFLFILSSGERFLNNTQYHLKINRDLKNMEGVTLRENFEGWFTADINDISVERIIIQNADDPSTVFRDVLKGEFNSYVPFTISVLSGENPDYFSIEFDSDFHLDSADWYSVADKITLTKIFPVSGVEYGKRNVSYTGLTLTVTFQDVPDEEDSIFRLYIKGGPEGVVDSNGAYLPENVFIYFKIEVTP